MMLYALSPGAYEGLLNLTKDSQWCSDYERVLRYLEVVVSMQQAKLVEKGAERFAPPGVNWKEVAVMEVTDELSIRRR
jgi:hypothetical protein